MVQTKVQQAFSDSALRYDQFSSLHRQIADGLVRQANKGLAPSTILDVGCGTGYLAKTLKENFPQAQVIGLDFAEGMLEAARLKHNGVTWILADSHHLPFADGRFDLVVSNLSYQWAADLIKALAQARRVLKPDGVLACTLFGFNTCRELFESFKEAKPGALHFSRLSNQSQVSQALAMAGFKQFDVKAQESQMSFKGMHNVISWLKSLGANNLPREGYIGKETMARAAAVYQQRFADGNGVVATFEVIRVYAQK